jgi:predicted Mrr-cat superfamily restriction endonuclease
MVPAIGLVDPILIVSVLDRQDVAHEQLALMDLLFIGKACQNLSLLFSSVVVAGNSTRLIGRRSL